jgi:hypothetical protein
MITETDRVLLGKLAEALGMTMGQVVRQSIRAAISHHLHFAPSCANGQPCYVPHMHPRRQANPTE